MFYCVFPRLEDTLIEYRQKQQLFTKKLWSGCTKTTSRRFWHVLHKTIAYFFDVAPKVVEEEEQLLDAGNLYTDLFSSVLSSFLDS